MYFCAKFKWQFPMNSNKQIFYLINRIWLSIKKAIPKALKTAKWLIKLTIPVTFTVFILNYSGILAKIAILFAPLFKFIGLPGESALVFISGVFANLYSVIALLGTLDITYRQGIILAVMSLISHGFIIETAILKSTGSSAIRMVLLRLTMSFVAAWLLNMLLPAFNTKMPSMLLHVQAGFWIALKYWFIDTLYLIGKILLIITALMINTNPCAKTYGPTGKYHFFIYCSLRNRVSLWIGYYERANGKTGVR